GDAILCAGRTSGKVKFERGAWTIRGGAEPGPVAARLRETLLDISAAACQTSTAGCAGSANARRPRLFVIDPFPPSRQRCSMPLEVFFSYAHEDQELRNRLDVHLASVKRLGIISAWHDSAIRPGQVWDQEIEVHIRCAHIILLLVSAYFFNSEYIYRKELA